MNRINYYKQASKNKKENENKKILLSEIESIKLDIKNLSDRLKNIEKIIKELWSKKFINNFWSIFKNIFRPKIIKYL